MNGDIEIDFEKGKVYKIRASKLTETGSVDVNGYVNICIDGKSIRAHRYIYEQYHNVKLTDDEVIDHINHNPSDNRICNLRILSYAQNTQWSRISKNNKSGYKHIYKEGPTWRVQIKKGMKRLYTKQFADIEDAVIARNEELNRLNRLGNCFYIPPPESEPALPETSAP